MSLVTHSNIYIKAVIPLLIYNIKGPLRVTSSVSIGILIVSEFMGGSAGIGRVLRYSINHSSIDLMIIGRFLASVMLKTII